MDHRIGICSACGAHYKIPASFIPNQARCRACSGVVHIRPPNGEARSRAPQRDAPAGREPRGDTPTIVAASAVSPSPTAGFAPSREPAQETPYREPVAQPRVEPELATQTHSERAFAPPAPSPAPRRSAARRVVWTALILAAFIGLWLWWSNRTSAPIQARSASSPGGPGGNGAASVHEDASRAGGEPTAGH